MANRRCLHALTRHASALFSTNTSLPSLPTPLPLPSQLLKTLASKSAHDLTTLGPTRCSHWFHRRHFSSNRETEDEDEDDDVEMGESSEDENVGHASLSNFKTEYTEEEREVEAAAIGYKVLGPLERSDWVFKPYEPVFAVVQIGSHQFKELTKLRITDIQGIEKPEKVVTGKPSKGAEKKPEKVAVAA